MGELEGKVAFLTGAGSGVGVGLALALAKAGAAIGLMGRTRETLEQTHAKLEALHRGVAPQEWADTKRARPKPGAASGEREAGEVRAGRSPAGPRTDSAARSAPRRAPTDHAGAAVPGAEEGAGGESSRPVRIGNFAPPRLPITS